MSQMASLIAMLQLFVIICLLTYLQNRNIKASQTLMYSAYNTLPNNLSVCRRTMCPFCCRCLSAVCLSVCLSQDNVSTLLPVFERCLSVCLSVAGQCVHSAAGV